MTAGDRVRLTALERRGADADAALDAFRSVLADGIFLNGSRTEAFERQLAASLGVAHVVGVGNGTDALAAGLVALGVEPGDEVIVPAFGAFATAAAVVAAGAEPVFADVEADQPLLDLSSVLAAVTDRTRAVVLVHLYGVVIDPAPWRRALEPRGIAVVEDAAQAHGGSGPEGAAAGTQARFGAFSFYPTKNLGALGDAGALVTDDAALAGAARAWRSHGPIPGRTGLVARNSRLDEIQAAWLSLRLPHLGAEVRRRRQLSSAYEDRLPSRLRYVGHGQGAPHLAVVRSADRDSLAQHLDRLGIDTGCHYPVALTRRAELARFASVPAPQAEAWAASCLTLPLHAALTDAEQDRVIEAVASWPVR